MAVVSLLDRRVAVNIVALVTFLVLVLLVSTPIRIHALIALLFLYSLVFDVCRRKEIRLHGRDKVVISLLSLYSLSHLPAFVMDDFSWRYLSPGLHMVAIIPVLIMLRVCQDELNERMFRNALEYGAFLGSLGGGILALYQAYWLGMPKVDGFIFHINFGYLVGSLFFLQVGLWFTSRRKGLVTLGILLSCLATLLSTSRGAYFAFPIVLAGVALWNARMIGHKKFLLGILAFVVLAFVSYELVPLVEKRVDYTIYEASRILEGDVENSSGGRIKLWAAAIEAFKERPLIGLTYPEREALNESLVGTGIIDEWTASISRGHAHSQYFETLATGGMIGVVALFFYLIGPALYFLYRNSGREKSWLSLPGLMFSLGFVVFCLTEVALQHEMIATYYAFMLVVIYVLDDSQESVAVAK